MSPSRHRCAVLLRVRDTPRTKLCAFAVDDLETDAHHPRRLAVARQTAKQLAHSLPAHLVTGHSHGRQRRIELRSKVEIAIARNRHAIGDGPLAPVAFLNGA